MYITYQISVIGIENNELYIKGIEAKDLDKTIEESNLELSEIIIYPTPTF